MRRAQSVALAVAIVTLGAPARAQACTESQYRWPEKTSLDFVDLAATSATIHAMLTTWPVPEIYHGDKCMDRSGRELKTYSVRGWVRLRKSEADLDWHIELTATKTAAVPDHCVVVEIPDPSFGHQFQIARDQFDALVTAAGVSFNGNTPSEPVRMKFLGVAFFDGGHRGAQGTSNPPSGHGRCGGTSRALWEIHPVYLVVAP